MVIRPHDADGHEAQRVPQVGWPQLPQRGEQRPAVLRRVGSGHVDLEHEQGDGDGEYAVAERLDARRVGCVGRDGHQTGCFNFSR